MRGALKPSERSPVEVFAFFIAAAASWFCARSSAENHEPILTTLLHSWLIEEPPIIPFGSVVDAGAQKGRATCDFSPKLAPSRTIFAVDPLRHNIASVNRSCGWRDNVRTLVGGLGATHTTLHVPWDKTRRAGQMISIASFTPGESPLGDSRDRVQAAHALENSRSGEAFEVHTVDELFETGAWQGERLGLGHWDTEGNELDVLRGAARTIARDRPLFTVELVVHKSPRYSAALLRFIAEIGYEALLIEEEVGWPIDTRNILALPRPNIDHAAAASSADAAASAGTLRRPQKASHSALFDAPHTHAWQSSRVLRRLIGAGWVVHVNASTILDHAYPCCQAGGVCCPRPSSCCMENTVPSRLPRYDPISRPKLRATPRSGLLWYEDGWKGKIDAPGGSRGPRASQMEAA